MTLTPMKEKGQELSLCRLASNLASKQRAAPRKSQQCLFSYWSMVIAPHKASHSQIPKSQKHLHEWCTLWSGHPVYIMEQKATLSLDISSTLSYLDHNTYKHKNLRLIQQKRLRKTLFNHIFPEPICCEDSNGVQSHLQRTTATLDAGGTDLLLLLPVGIP